MQDYAAGSNDLYSAKAARFYYALANLPLSEGYNRKWQFDYQVWITEALNEWGRNSDLITVQVFTFDGWEVDFLGVVTTDIILLAVAVCLVSVYSYIVLGSFSPVHFRAVTAAVGMFCVLISIAAGYAICFLAGLKITNFHNILPFMVIGIGVDNMFVIVNCIDQAPEDYETKKRFRIGLGHAGPSITITSVTDAIAFFIGSISSLPALKGLCIFAGICIFSLYFCILTIFCAWFLSDLQRMKAKKPDCFGLCCCKMDSIFCCRGKLLTTKQRRFIGLATDENADETKEYTSYVEKFFDLYYTKAILSKWGKVSVLVFITLFAMFEGYGLSQMRTDFSVEYFIPEGTHTYDYFQMDLEYFQTGFFVKTVVDNPNIDYSSEATQLQLLDFYDKLQRNYLCEENWFVQYSLSTWYLDFMRWMEEGQCSVAPDVIKGFQRVVPQEYFYPCLEEALQKVGAHRKDDLLWRQTDVK